MPHSCSLFPRPQKEGTQKFPECSFHSHFTPMRDFPEAAAQKRPWSGLGRPEAVSEAGGGRACLSSCSKSPLLQPGDVCHRCVRDCADTVLLRQRQDVTSNCECAIHRAGERETPGRVVQGQLMSPPKQAARPQAPGGRGGASSSSSPAAAPPLLPSLLFPLQPLEALPACRCTACFPLQVHFGLLVGSQKARSTSA